MSASSWKVKQREVGYSLAKRLSAHGWYSIPRSRPQCQTHILLGRCLLIEEEAAKIGPGMTVPVILDEKVDLRVIDGRPSVSEIVGLSGANGCRYTPSCRSAGTTMMEGRNGMDEDVE